MNLSGSNRILVVLLAISMGTSPAYAYLDPGTGSIILQGLIAAIAGAALLLKLYWRRIKSLFLATFSSKEAASEGKESTAQSSPESRK